MFSGRKAMPEMMKKSSFAQTCNRLSQFLKERRSLGDFASFQNMSSSMLDTNGTKEMTSAPTNTTMNLFPEKMEEGKNVSTGEENIKSLDLFPLTSSPAAASTANTNESTKNMADWSESPRSKEDLKTTGAKMTIFYDGQVIVFEDLPEDKAEEIISLASQLGTLGSRSETQTQVQAQTLNLPNNILMAQPTQGSILQQPASLSDLPIARRVSLHRFIEKRKDRIAGASPYQVHRNMAQSLSEKYDLMRQLRQQQHQQQELELKLF